MSYFEEARARARRRKSPWNLLLIAAVVGSWLLVWYVSAKIFGQIVRHVRPELQFVLLPDSGGSILMAFGLFFASLPFSMVVGNLVVAIVPPARRALDREAANVPGTDLVSSNRSVLKVAAFLTPAGLLIALIGFLVV